MAIKKQIERELGRLFDARSYPLRKAIGIAGRGTAPRLSKARLRKSIEKLQDLSSDMWARKEAQKAMKLAVAEKRQWHAKKGKGWGRDAKKKKFKAWFDQKCGYQNYIYVFWSGRKCTYVGQSTQGRTRPTAHFEKHWFGSVTRIDLANVPWKSEVGELECLSMHYYKPARNKYRPASRKWTKKCPICNMHRAIESEMQRIFPVRKKGIKK
jgi:hypothetical protein